MKSIATKESYYRARFYDPQIGRFIGEDPLRIGRVAQTINPETRVPHPLGCKGSGLNSTSCPAYLRPAVAPPLQESAVKTGVYYYRARYYDSTTGRFLTEDPMGLGGDGINFYRYTRNSPTNLVDPSGLKIICPFWNPACRSTITKHLSDCAKKILGPYFPGVNLDAVELVSQLPGFATLAPIDGGVGAITVGNIISYQPGQFSGSAQGLSEIGHELTHVQQQSGGLLSFLGNYVGSYLKNLSKGDGLDGSYENIEAEIEARRMGGRILGDLLRKYGPKDPCEKYCQ